MFTQSQVNKEFDMFSSPTMMVNEKYAAYLADPKSWFNEFFRNVTCAVDENIFRPLYSAKKNGRPNAPIRMLVAMMILKEGEGYSDRQLFENCCCNMICRLALGSVSMLDQMPCPASYYNFRKALAAYEEKTGVDLLEECFKGITKKQAVMYRVNGKAVRMDSKLISSNIAWYSRYEIIHKTFVKAVSKDLAMTIEDEKIREEALEFLDENAAKTVYETKAEDMAARLFRLGIVIDYILTHFKRGLSLLRRVFGDQYVKGKDGSITVRDKKDISADSVQNPNDPEASYRSKSKQKVKGFVTNVTETTGQENAPSLITDVQVKKASAADNTFVADAVAATEEVTGNKVKTVHADGAYQSEANRKLANDEKLGFDFITNGIQGKPGRYDLEKKEDGTLIVTDKQAEETIKAERTRKGDKWKVKITKADGTKAWRYFDEGAVERCRARHEIESLSYEERKKRNNVEATIFQYCFHTRNNKTRYRGLTKHKMQAYARCAWINMRRIFLYKTKIG